MKISALSLPVSVSDINAPHASTDSRPNALIAVFEHKAIAGWNAKARRSRKVKVGRRFRVWRVFATDDGVKDR